MKELFLQRQKAHLVLVKEFLLSCEDITERVVFNVYNGVEREGHRDLLGCIEFLPWPSRWC